LAIALVVLAVQGRRRLPLAASAFGFNRPKIVTEKKEFRGSLLRVTSGGLFRWCFQRWKQVFIGSVNQVLVRLWTCFLGLCRKVGIPAAFRCDGGMR
jgi:hypothetical protein